MEFDKLKKELTVILNKDIDGISAGTIGIVDEVFDNEMIISWELPEKLRKCFNIIDIKHLNYYMRLNPQPLSDDFPW